MSVQGRPRPARPAPPALSARKQAAFSLLALLFVLGAVEGSVRLYHWVRGLGAPAEEARGYVIDDPDAGYTLKPGFQQGALRVNQLGFRGPEIQREKAPGVRRIVALGDSATFGPHEEECAYPYRLARLLPSQPVEVVNAGVEGYRTDRALVRLQKDVLPLKPDVVTVFIGWNDLYQTDPRAEDDQLSLRGSPLAEVLRWSDAAQTFRRLIFLRLNTQRASTAAVGDDALLQRYRPEGYAERLRAIFRAVRSGGAEPLALTWPTILSESMSPAALAKVQYPWYTQQLGDLKLLYARYQESLRRVAQEERVPVVEAAARLDAAGGDKADLFVDAVHPTCAGQAMVAEAVAGALGGSR